MSSEKSTAAQDPQQQLKAVAERVFRAQSASARAHFDADPTPSGVVALAARTHEFAEQVITFALEHTPASLRPACQNGCTACCYLHVVTSAPEVLRIADDIRTRFSSDQIASLHERLTAHVSLTSNLDAPHRRRLRLPCPLLDLDFGGCTIYRTRPLTCRAWNSLDRALCDADLLSPDSLASARLNPAQYYLTMEVSSGLTAGLSPYPLDLRPLDLVRALLIALNNPDASDSWLTGALVFAPAWNEAVFPK